MDINKLALLCDVADTNNLTLSAERMGYTQSGVSHAINKLEAEIGIPIIKRTKHGVELTAEGAILMPYIRLVVTHYGRLDEVVNSILGLQRGSICIGTYSSIASQWLPEIIKKYQELYPNIAIRIREGGSRDIERWLYEGSIDFGFLSWKKNQTFKFLSLARDPLYAVVPKDYTLPKDYQKEFPIKAFSEYPFIASETGEDHDITGTLEHEGVTPMTSFTCSDDHIIIPMVEKGLGISFLPDMFLQGLDNGVQKIPVIPCSVRTLGIGIMSEKALSTCSKAFIQLSQKMVAELTSQNRE